MKKPKKPKPKAPKGAKKVKDALILKALQWAIGKAKTLAHNMKEVLSLVDRAFSILNKLDADVWNDLKMLCRLVQAYFRREYTEVPWATIILAIAAIF